MVIDLKFESACQIVKSDYPELAKEIDVLSNIIIASGIAIFAVPVTEAVGPAVITPLVIILTAIGTISNFVTVKNEIPKTIDSIISKITSKRDQDPHEQFMRMQRAYTLICYTAFFDALRHDRQLEPLLKKIKLSEEEKRQVLIYAVRDLLGKVGTSADDVETSQLSFEIDLPHPGDTFETQQKCLLPLYQKLAERIEKFFEMDIVIKQVQAKGGQEKIKDILVVLPEKGLKLFRDQYSVLAMKFPEFAIWLNLQKDDKLVQLMEGSLQLLKESLQAEQRQTDAVLHALANHYTSIIEEPIIDDPGSQLSYPKKRDIFILQSFKVTHYKDAEQLKDIFWEGLPERQNLEGFLQAYFNHEESSTKTPLIILGQPGSGKSLLTTMIAARHISLPFTSIRVELRHTNAEDPISAQIEGQIKRDTDRNFDWTTLRDHTIYGPPLVLFDGYDELLQATGKVFSGYLNQVREFQLRQIALSGGEQSVRAVVTSRFTLIDKAVIPPGSTIIRLLEFDEGRQNSWINQWNATNASYFQRSQTSPFKLPQGHDNINRLAEQPLLLMMLAIYDSEGNPLHGATSDLDQSLLYNRLLRRFVEREMKKEEAGVYSWQQSELDEAVDREIERLGAAAIGMFNRRKIYIQSGELNADLKFFDLEKSSLEMTGHERLARTGHELLPSEKVFGGFFFQKLESVRKTRQSTTSKAFTRADDTAYEFLHNTFGEFLTADFMLRKILEETEAIREMQTGKKSLRNTRAKKIDQIDGLEPGWFARFMYAPLFSRPVIATLLREWSRHCVRNSGRDLDEFLSDLGTIVVSHINLLLTSNFLPSLMLSDQHPFAVLPTVGYLAIYTLNLILLRTLLDPNGYIFDEANSVKSEDGTLAWDRLAYLWRSWYSLGTLNELAVILEARRDDSKIHLKIKKDFSASTSIDRFYQVLRVSQALADNITGGLASLLAHNAFNNSEVDLDNIRKKLETEQLDSFLRGDLSIKRLRHLRKDVNLNLQKITNFFKENTIRDILSDLENEEVFSILINEIYRIMREVYELKGDDLELNKEFFNAYYDNGIVAVEQMNVSTINSNIIVANYIVDNFSRNFDKKMSNNLLNQRLLVEVSQYILQRGYRGIPQLLNLEQLQELVDKQGYLLMALAAVKMELAHENGNQEMIDFIYGYYSKHVADLDAPMSINLATELVKSARERGDWSVRDYFVKYLLKQVQKQKIVPVEFALEVINLVFETGDKQVVAQFIADFMHAFQAAERRLPLALMNELLKTLLQIEDQQAIQKLSYEYFMPYIKEMNIPNIPQELVISIIKLVRKIEDQEMLGYFSHNYFINVLNIQMIVSIELAVELLRLALETKTYNQEIVEGFYHKNITLGRCYLGLLPIDTVVDLRHLAQKYDDEELIKKIDQRLKVLNKGSIN